MSNGRYQVSLIDPYGVQSILGAVAGDNEREAWLAAGKLVRRVSEETLPDGLDPNGIVSVEDHQGHLVGEATKVGEHLSL